MKPLPTLLAAAALLASAGVAVAEPARSLHDARTQINSGTWPGITLIEAKPKAAKARPPAGAASAAPEPATTAAPEAARATIAPTPATSPPTVAERLRALLGPASGVPMNQAARLDSPDLGIVLPTGAATPGVASAPPGAGK